VSLRLDDAENTGETVEVSGFVAFVEFVDVLTLICDGRIKCGNNLMDIGRHGPAPSLAATRRR
jgi:hypothetical protein